MVQERWIHGNPEGFRPVWIPVSAIQAVYVLHKSVQVVAGNREFTVVAGLEDDQELFDRAEQIVQKASTPLEQTPIDLGTLIFEEPESETPPTHSPD